MRELQIRVGFRDYKSGQEGLQIGVAKQISNRSEKITNWGRDFKSESGQGDFKSGQEILQTGAGISNWVRDYKLVQNMSLNFCDCSFFFFSCEIKLL